MPEVRRLIASDVDVVRELLRTCWLDTYVGLLPDHAIKTAINLWQSKENLLRGIQNPSAYYAGYFSEGKPEGMVSAGKVNEDTLKVFQLYVLPSSQRKGVGSTLMNDAIKHFEHVRKVVLEVEEGNQKGISFYRKYGFAYPSRTMVKVGQEEIPCLVGELLL